MKNALDWAARAPDAFWRDRKEARKAAKLSGRFLACVYILIYAGSYYLWEEPLNLLTSWFPPVLGALTRCIAPAAFGALICALFWRLPVLKRGAMTAAYSFLTRWTVILLIITEWLLWGERRGQVLIFLFVVRFILAPVFIGNYTALRLYYIWWTRNKNK